MTTGTPIYEHGLSDELLLDLQNLRSLRIDLVQKQIEDVEQTQRDIMDRDLFGGDVFTVEELASTLNEKLLELQKRLDSPKAIFTDEIEFFLDVAND